MIIGCGLGATSLYFVPHHDHTEATQKMKRTKQILSDMLRDNAIDCDDCAVYLNDAEYEVCSQSELPTTSGETKVHLRTMSTSKSTIHKQCLRDGSIISNSSGDRPLLYAPIFGMNNQPLGIIEFAMKTSSDRNFGEKEELIAKITARHIGIVLDENL